MKLGFIVLYVPDVAAATTFYQQAFGLGVHFADPAGRFTEMDTGATLLVFVAESTVEGVGRTFHAHRPYERPAAGEVGFVADDVEAAYETAIKAGADPYDTPKRRSDGSVVACVRDLNGVLVEICSAAEPAADEAWRHTLRG